MQYVDGNDSCGGDTTERWLSIMDTVQPVYNLMGDRPDFVLFQWQQPTLVEGKQIACTQFEV
jgi:hypothetical protein